MQDGSKLGKAVGGVSDVLASGKGNPDARTPAADRRPYAKLPDRSRKWPMPLRVVFITGAAAALWGLIFLTITLL